MFILVRAFVCVCLFILCVPMSVCVGPCVMHSGLCCFVKLFVRTVYVRFRLRLSVCVSVWCVAACVNACMFAIVCVEISVLCMYTCYCVCDSLCGVHACVFMCCSIFCACAGCIVPLYVPCVYLFFVEVCTLCACAYGSHCVVSVCCFCVVCIGCVRSCDCLLSHVCVCASPCVNIQWWVYCLPYCVPCVNVPVVKMTKYWNMCAMQFCVWCTLCSLHECVCVLHELSVVTCDVCVKACGGSSDVRVCTYAQDA